MTATLCVLEMMMQQQPMMMGPVSQPLIQQPVPFSPPAYTAMPPVTVIPQAPVMVPAPSGPVQNNTASQSVVINQAGNDGSEVQRLFVDPLGVRGWSSSLCGCLDDLGSCACAIILPPLLMCRMANRMKECAFISCAIPGGFTAMRVKLRTMGGIRGSICQDCLITHFCPLCAACQMSRELDAMGL